MMIDPPIDKLIKRAECRYALACGVSKRSRELHTSDNAYLANRGEKPVNRA